MKFKSLPILYTLFISVTFYSCSTFFQSEKSNYVKVNSTQFTMNGKPYYFIGANFWYAVYLGASGELGDRDRLIKELDHLKSLGITNLRIMGASEKSYIKDELSPSFQSKPGVYNENLLEGLDFLLSEMLKRNMQAVIFLNNNWDWSGGMSQYNAWSNEDTTFIPPDPKTDYDNFMNYSNSFYRNEKAKRIFYHYIYSLLKRKNIYSGYRYCDDPAIMAWQLSNEPRPGKGAEALKWIEEYYRWLDVTALYIHSLDHNHLISTGSEGIAGSVDSTEIFLTAHKSRNIDYLTFHLWPYDWGWYNPDQVDSTYLPSENKSTDYINKHINIARKLDKPIVMEEFGLPRDNRKRNIGSPTTIKDKYFEKILSVVYDSANNGAPIAGANVWFWGGEGNPKNLSYEWGFGNPIRPVDNFNSVYYSDTSTINILSKYAVKMSSINKEFNNR